MMDDRRDDGWLLFEHDDFQRGANFSIPCKDINIVPEDDGVCITVSVGGTAWNAQETQCYIPFDVLISVLTQAGYTVM
ncbi:MAG: hypothetical protein NUW00_03555 [Candidatus Kaiserbacteria bacterium]|nr:hypothetical protein [Candidatus Kaiserbacteria bacterium]MCR4330418.1 hypothetical protein [Patescibacteria group bacterium]